MISNKYKELMRLAKAYNFTVTSTTGGKHNVGSRHYLGFAIDVRTRDKTNAQIEHFIKVARAFGVFVKDERRHPPRQSVWSGAHLHLGYNLRTRIPAIIR